MHKKERPFLPEKSYDNKLIVANNIDNSKNIIRNESPNLQKKKKTKETSQDP